MGDAECPPTVRLALERELARAEGWSGLGARGERQHCAEGFWLGVRELERVLLREDQPHPRLGRRLEPAQQPSRLLELERRAVGEGQPGEAAAGRAVRRAAVPQHELARTARRERGPHRRLALAAPPPVDAAEAAEVLAKVEVARAVARPPFRGGVRLVPARARAVLREPQEGGPARRVAPAQQPHPTRARVAQPLPPEVRAVQHEHTAQRAVRLRLPRHQRARAAALCLEGGRLPAHDRSGRELGLHGGGGAGGLGSRRARGDEREHASQQRQSAVEPNLACVSFFLNAGVH